MKDLIIIGSGPIGIYASSLAASQNLETLILESSLDIGGQLTLYPQKPIYDFPSYDQINAEDLIINLLKQQAKYGSLIETKTNVEVKGLKTFDTHIVVETSVGTFEAKYVLIASGSGLFSPRKLELDHIEKASNIFYQVKQMEEVREKHVVILGGGDSAIDWALELKKYAKSITLVHRRHQFRAHEANVLKARETTKVLTPYIPIGFKGDEQVDALILRNHETKEEIEIKADILYVFYGMMPSKNSFEAWPITQEGIGFKVNTMMQTSHHLIYAAGNIAQYEGKIQMIVTGMGEAATAIAAITHKLYPNKKVSYGHQL